MLNNLIFFIKKNQLFSNKDSILLAVSGGADSVVLAHLFKLIKINFAIVHCNFKLRGEESDKDAEFVENIAINYNIPFFYKEFETKQFAKQNKLSIQMAARELRYNFFEQVSQINNYDYIATAHNKNDEVETMLLNIIKSTGIKGLSGIKAKQNNIIRPLLFANKNDILEYAKHNNIEYREDKSNEDDKYQRNLIRNKIIPLICHINPNFINTAAENISIFKDIENIYDEHILKQKNEIFDDNKIDTANLLNTIAPASLLFEILNKYGFSSKQSAQIFQNIQNKSIPGKIFYSSTNIALIDRQFVIISKIEKQENIEYLISKDTQNIDLPVKLNFEIVKKTDSFQIIKEKNICYFDYDKLKFPLKLRIWQDGDYFYPFGMNKAKKISDFLIDNKVNLIDKQKILLILSGKNIIWLVNQRADNRYRITEKTKKILIITKK